MNLYFVRHADPNYEIDGLTEIGKVQAEKTSLKLKHINFDYIFASPKGRAIQTAKYLSSKQNKDLIILPFANEDIAVKYFMRFNEEANRNRWIFHHNPSLHVMSELSEDDKWFEHDFFKGLNLKEGIEFYENEVDKWLETFGIRHDRVNKRYIKIEGIDTPENIVLFAHGGMAFAFISSLLDMTYSYFASHFAGLDTCGVVHFEFDLNTQIIKLKSYNEIFYDLEDRTYR